MKYSEAAFYELRNLLYSLIAKKFTNLSETSEISIPEREDILIDNDGVLWAKQLSSETLTRISRNCNFPSFHFRSNLVNTAAPINPMMFGISQNAIYVNKEKCDIDDVISYVFNSFDYKTIDCHGDSITIMSQCETGSNPIFLDFESKEEKEKSGSVDINHVPAFIEQLPAKYWRAFEPECVIWSADEKSVVKYRNVSCHDYTLNSLEEHYFGRNENLLSSSEKEEPSQRKVMIKGHCVLTIVHQKEEDIAMFIFHLEKIFLACYGVSDVRWLYTEDEMFHPQLIQQIVSKFSFSITCPSPSFTKAVLGSEWFSAKNSK